MNITNLRSAVTVLSLIIFVGIWVWAWSKRHTKGFNEAANLPFEDEVNE